MSTIWSQSHPTRAALLSKKRPLIETTPDNKIHQVISEESSPRIKRRKSEYRHIVEQNQDFPCATKATTRQPLEGDAKQTDLNELDCNNGDEYKQQNSSTCEVKPVSRMRPTGQNIFHYLNFEEANWLVQKVNEVNRSIFGTQDTVEKLKQLGRELKEINGSLCVLK